MSEKKVQGSRYLQSIKSLPVDFRVGSPNSELRGKSSGVNSNNGRVIMSESIAENVETLNEVVEGNADADNDDSPYSSLNASLEVRPSVVGDDLNSEASSLRSVGLSRVDSKWSDTKTYSAKKVVSCTCCFGSKVCFKHV